MNSERQGWVWIAATAAATAAINITTTTTTTTTAAIITTMIIESFEMFVAKLCRHAGNHVLLTGGSGHSRQARRPCLPVVRLARVRNPCPGDNIDCGAISREDDELLPCPADRNGRHWTRVELSVVLLKYRCKLAWQMWSRRGPVVQQAAA